MDAFCFKYHEESLGNIDTTGNLVLREWSAVREGASLAYADAHKND